MALWKRVLVAGFTDTGFADRYQYERQGWAVYRDGRRWLCEEPGARGIARIFPSLRFAKSYVDGRIRNFVEGRSSYPVAELEPAHIEACHIAGRAMELCAVADFNASELPWIAAMLRNGHAPKMFSHDDDPLDHGERDGMVYASLADFHGGPECATCGAGWCSACDGPEVVANCDGPETGRAHFDDAKLDPLTVALFNS